MSESIIKSEKTTILDLFESKKIWLNVPNYQRPYVWYDDSINQLLEDLWYSFEENSIENQSEYFLGAIVLNELPKDLSGVSIYEILDGQQRLITLILIYAVLRDLFDYNEDSAKKACRDIISQDYDRFKLIPKRNRIVFCNEKVNTFFDNFIVKNDATSKKSN